MVAGINTDTVVTDVADYLIILGSTPYLYAGRSLIAQKFHGVLYQISHHFPKLHTGPTYDRKPRLYIDLDTARLDQRPKPFQRFFHQHVQTYFLR